MLYTSRHFFNKKFYEVRNFYFFRKNGTTGRDRSIMPEKKLLVEMSYIYYKDRYAVAVHTL